MKIKFSALQCLFLLCLLLLHQIGFLVWMDGVQWWAFVNTVMKLWLLKVRVIS